MGKHEELVKVLKEKKDGQTAIKAEYAELEKVKKLTTEQRLARIEKIMGLAK